MMRKAACRGQRESMFIVRNSTSFPAVSETDFADHRFHQPTAKPEAS